MKGLFYFMAIAAALVHGQSVESCLQDPVIAARVEQATNKYIKELETSFKPINDKFLKQVIAETAVGSAKTAPISSGTKIPGGFEDVAQKADTSKGPWAITPPIVPPGFSSTPKQQQQPKEAGSLAFGKRAEKEPSSQWDFKYIEKELKTQQQEQLAKHSQDARIVFAQLACGPQLKGRALKKAIKDTRTQLKAAWDKVGTVSFSSAQNWQQGPVATTSSNGARPAMMNNNKRDKISEAPANPVSKQAMPAGNNGIVSVDGIGAPGATSGSFGQGQQQQAPQLIGAGQTGAPTFGANNGLSPTWSTPNVQLPQPIPVNGRQSPFSATRQAPAQGSGWTQQQAPMGMQQPQQQQQFMQPQQQMGGQGLQPGQISQQQPFGVPSTTRMMAAQSQFQQQQPVTGFGQQQTQSGILPAAGQQFAGQQQPTRRRRRQQQQQQQQMWHQQQIMPQQQQQQMWQHQQIMPQQQQMMMPQQQMQQQSSLPPASAGTFPADPNGSFPTPNGSVVSSQRIQRRGLTDGLRNMFGALKGGIKSVGKGIKGSGKGVGKVAKSTGGLSRLARFGQWIDTHRGVAVLTTLGGVMFAGMVAALAIGKAVQDKKKNAVALQDVVGKESLSLGDSTDFASSKLLLGGGDDLDEVSDLEI